MLPKPRRLLTKDDFDRVFKNGRVLKGPFLRLIWTEGKGRGAVVVAKAVGSNARRNTIRRRWREALRALETPTGLDLVFVVGVGGAAVRGVAVTNAMQEALTQVSR